MTMHPNPQDQPDSRPGGEAVGQADWSTLVLLEQVRTGDAAAAAEIFDRFAGRMAALAAARMPDRIARRLDSEDIVQSVFRSFFHAMKEPRFVFQRSGDLWRLLAAMTLTKLYGQITFHSALRRSFDREEGGSLAIERLSGDLLRREPSAEEALCLADLLGESLAGLDAKKSRVIELRLQDYSLDEIALIVGVSERSVRRYILEFREKLSRKLAEEPEASGSPGPSGAR